MDMYSQTSVLRRCTGGPLFYGHVQSDLCFTNTYSQTSILGPCTIGPLFYEHVHSGLCFTDMCRKTCFRAMYSQTSDLRTCIVGPLLYRHVQLDLYFTDTYSWTSVIRTWTVRSLFYGHAQSDFCCTDMYSGTCFMYMCSRTSFFLQKQGHSVSKFGVSNKFRVCLSRLGLNFRKYFFTLNDTIFQKRTVKLRFDVPNRPANLTSKTRIKLMMYNHAYDTVTENTFHQRPFIGGS